MNNTKSKTERPDFFGPADPAAYDAWFRAKVQEALDGLRPAISHEEATRRMEVRRAKLLAPLNEQ